MALKFTPLLKSVTRISKSTVACMSSGYGHGHHKSPLEVAREHRVTLNDMPVPTGPWQEYHSKRSAKLNILLGASVVTLFATFYVMKKAHVFYFHSSPDFKSVEINVK